MTAAIQRAKIAPPRHNPMTVGEATGNPFLEIRGCFIELFSYLPLSIALICGSSSTMVLEKGPFNPYLHLVVSIIRVSW